MYIIFIYINIYNLYISDKVTRFKFDNSVNLHPGDKRLERFGTKRKIRFICPIVSACVCLALLLWAYDDLVIHDGNLW